MNLLTNQVDCDLVLADAAEERADLEYRQTQLRHLQSVGSGRASEKGAELVAATAEYNALERLLVDMPEGPTRQKNERAYKRLEYRIYVLNQQQQTGLSGVVTQFQRHYELNCLGAQLGENATLTTEVQARRAAL
ncbi:hypothetical protein [Hymenobacter rubripertinctus]|uniref:hypothetical protein n=1 Tax=Hymenobacter rubripertinctus TaxID=2029981 RepID=UPI0011C401F2|nr:hypothetical protein [Hymenobacter rubripertinctus]